MIRIRDVAHGYWFELLIAFLAIAGMLELVVGRDSPGAVMGRSGAFQTTRRAQ